jgi:hypothetical protein
MATNRPAPASVVLPHVAYAMLNLVTARTL